MVFEGRVYETEGSNPVAVHDWTEARLLSPVGHAPSVRFFPARTNLWADEAHDWDFSYLNPACILGPNEMLKKPEYAPRLTFEPCLGVVIAGAGKDVPVGEADDLVLGLCLMNSFALPEAFGVSRSRDTGLSVGPAIITPDELDDSVTSDERGRRYRFSVGARVNGEEVFSLELSNFGYTVAEAIAYASQSAPIKSGDVFALSLGATDASIGANDEVQVFSDKLGVLSNRIVA